MSTSLIQFSGTTSELSVSYNPPITLTKGKSYLAAITGGYIPVVWPNVTAGNNVIRISYDSGLSWATIEFQEGQYDVFSIGDKIATFQKQYTSGTAHPFVVAGEATLDTADDVVGINLSGDSTTSKAVILLRENYQIDLGTMGTMLGWTNNMILLTHSTNIYSPHIPNVAGDYVYYKIFCDLVAPQAISNASGAERLLYANSPATGAGSNQTIPQDGNTVWVPVDSAITNISRAKCWLTDQTGKALNIREQPMCIIIMIKPL